MNIQIRTSGGIALASVESCLVNDRTLFIEGEINSVSACEFLKNMIYLNRLSSEKSIDVLINSQGGEINAGLMMYDVIQSSKAPVRMFCVGRAYSMGAVLFASGRHGRFMLPNSELMIHEPLIGNRLGGSASSIKSISDNLMETRRKMNSILAKHTGRTEAELEEATSFDHYFSPEESISFGLCDSVVDFDKITEVHS